MPIAAWAPSYILPIRNEDQGDAGQVHDVAASLLVGHVAGGYARISCAITPAISFRCQPPGSGLSSRKKIRLEGEGIDLVGVDDFDGEGHFRIRIAYDVLPHAVDILGDHRPLISLTPCSTWAEYCRPMATGLSSEYQLPTPLLQPVKYAIADGVDASPGAGDWAPPCSNGYCCQRCPAHCCPVDYWLADCSPEDYSPAGCWSGGKLAGRKPREYDPRGRTN